MNFGTVQEYIESNKEVEDLTINGKCSRCGHCCGAILPVTQQEVERIKKYIAKNNIKLVPTLRIFATRTQDLTCPFYEQNKCLVYEVRPKICKEFICNKTPDEALSRGLIGNYKNIRLENFRKVFGGQE
jgi:Fe-S-cluster containining protein